MDPLVVAKAAPVPCKSRLQPSWSQGTAGVEVPSCWELELAQSPDGDGLARA
jgi:hypothetical protein